MPRTNRPGESTPQPEGLRLGAALRRAWVGYQERLAEEMRAGGSVRRNFPDGRVLHLCRRSADVTISEIGRELGMTRQGASKIVRVLRDEGFVTVAASPDDGRERRVNLTDAATTYLEVQRKAALDIERRLKRELGVEAFDALYGLLDQLGGDETPRLRTFLREHTGGT